MISNELDTRELNSRILDLWNRHKNSHEQAFALVPMVYPPLKKHCLLFIGFNPSFSVKGIKQFLSKEPDLSPDLQEVMNNPDSFYSLANWDRTKLATCLKIENLAKKHYKYFGLFKKISAHVFGREDICEHVDLFFHRGTEQNNVKAMVLDPRTKDPTAIGMEELRISMDLIVALEPRAIVVANADGSKVFQGCFQKCTGLPLDMDIDERDGTYYLHSRPKIPVFLSSMLSGVRALDTESRKRLQWHIKRLLIQQKEGESETEVGQLTSHF